MYYWKEWEINNDGNKRAFGLFDFWANDTSQKTVNAGIPKKC